VDVNGYYRELGLPYGIRPSRKQLRVAYQAKNGQESRRLTSILTFLLDEETREDYNGRRVGDVVFDDLFSERIKRSALLAARHRGVTQDEVMDGWGLRNEDTLPPGPEIDVPTYLPSSPRGVASARVTWPWSWYADHVSSIDPARLPLWQQLLTHHLLVNRFAVGVSGYGDPVSVRLVGGEWAIFLREDREPDEELALIAQQKIQTQQKIQMSANTYALQNGSTRRTMKYAGGQAARKTVESESNSSFGDRKKYHYISTDLKAVDDSTIIRFLDDVEPGPDERNFWITLATHDYVPVKSAPRDMDDDKKQRWPETMTAICRTQKLLQGEHEDCYICENLTKPDKNKVERPWSKSGTTFARAIKRERVKVTQHHVDTGVAPAETLGKVALRDVEEEVDELNEEGKATGRKITRPVIYLVQQKWSNFFQQLSVLAESYNDTVLDRDYKVTRMGVKLDTKYVFAPQKEIPEFDLSNPETRVKYDEAFPWEDLVEFIDNLHSDEYYARFFDTRVEAPSQGSSTSKAPAGYEDDDEEDASPPQSTKAPVDKAKRDALRARMLGKTTASDEEPANA
jgi:hypothetical protein